MFLFMLLLITVKNRAIQFLFSNGFQLYEHFRKFCIKTDWHLWRVNVRKQNLKVPATVTKLKPL